MKVPCYTPPTFSVDASDSWKRHLAEYGYVVLHNVLDNISRNHSIELFWKDWNTISPHFNRYNPSTWSIDTAPMMFAKGMALFNGFGQSDFMWSLRTQDPIKEIFSKVHGVAKEDLVTSFDGFGCFFSRNQRPGNWLHIDQNPNNLAYSVQGAYNFFPVHEDSAGFIVVPRTHRMGCPRVSHLKDWIPITDPTFPEPVKLLIPENCFTLWNSRTVHANTGLTYKDNPDELDRLTAYITMEPRTVSNALVANRMHVYLNGDACSHWPNKVEIKRYPWGFGPRFDARGFHKLPKPITFNAPIPPERLMLI